MSGIFGVIHTSGRPAETEELAILQNALSHRAVDGQQTWREGPAGLGHSHMRVTPESKYEVQPLAYRHWVMVADARLDDRDHLCDKLNLPPPERPRTPDSRLILLAYEKWGDRLTDHLLGDFAFAIWDRKERQLFCVRDHVGTRPFFYYQDSERIVFASEIRAIACLPFVSTHLNTDKLKDYALNFLWYGPAIDRTLIGNIRRLMPARRLTWRNGQIDIRKYWEPSAQPGLRLRSGPEYIEALRELMEKAVHDRLRSDFPVGIQLSGGLDSASAACLAAGRLAGEGKVLHSASSVLPAGAPEGLTDERHFIEDILRQEENIRSQFITGKDAPFLKDIHRLFERTYSPVNSFYYLDEALFAALRQREVRLTLDGLGGDTTVSHYSGKSMAHLVRTRQLAKAWTLLKQRKKVRQNASYLNLLKREVIQPFTPAWALKTYRRLRGLPHPPRHIDTTPASESWISAREAERLYQDMVRKLDRTGDVYSFIWNTDLNYHQEEWTTRMAHHRLESTHPWTDPRIIDFLFSLPPEHFVYQGHLRGLIRFAMDGIIPSSVQWRTTKGAFSPDYLRRFADALPEIEAVLIRNSNKYHANQYFDLQKIRKEATLVKSFDSKMPNRRGIISVFGLGVVYLSFLEWQEKREKIRENYTP